MALIFRNFWLGFPPVAHLGYLPDVARLDLALRESYHAADSAPLPEAEFQRLLGADISGLRLRLAPALRLVRSDWPVVSIWAAHHAKGPPPTPGPRMRWSCAPTLTTAAAPPACRRGRLRLGPAGPDAPMGESLDLAGPDLDLAAVLGLLIAGRAIVGADA